jgi:hypothetical protein
MTFSSPLSLRLGLIWAAAMLLVALTLPTDSGWTIDDGEKLIAAQNGTGVWAERIPDGPIRATLQEPSIAPPLVPPFAIRTDSSMVLGFSPWTRALFKAVAQAGAVMWRVFPALIAILFWLALEQAGLPYAFLLLPLTFYGLVPWEHGLSWLAAWPALWVVFFRQGPSRALSLFGGVCLSAAMVLRPESGILAPLLVVFLLLTREYAKGLLMALGAIGGLAALLVWHQLTSTAPAFIQLTLNLMAGGEPDTWAWITSKLLAAYGTLLRMNANTWASWVLIVTQVGGTLLLFRYEKQKSRLWLWPGLLLLAAGTVFYLYHIWAAEFPPIKLLTANSLLACLPWVLVLCRPPFRNRPALWLGMIAIAAALVIAPVWEGVHWGPRTLLFAIPLLLIDLVRTGRARGTAFYVLLALTLVQTVNATMLVRSRAEELSIHVRNAARSLGSPVICPTVSQCVDLAPLWKDCEFFVASRPRELEQLLIELRFAGVDTVWMHLEAHDSLYVKTFPTGKPVTPVKMNIIQARSLYRTWWRIYELAMNRKDSRWAGILESEAGELMLESQPAKALRLQRVAVSVAPHSAESNSNLALFLAQVGKNDEARAEARAALDLDPNLKEPVRLLEILSNSPSTSP